MRAFLLLLGRPQQVMQGGRSVMGGFSGVMRGSMAGSGIW
jgi:hypothetical protein